jgi:hypothetical protein
MSGGDGIDGVDSLNSLSFQDWSKGNGDVVIRMDVQDAHGFLPAERIAENMPFALAIFIGGMTILWEI